MKGYKTVVFTEGLVSRINDILTECDKVQSIIDKETFIEEVETQGWFGRKKTHREYWNITEFHNLLMKHVFKGSIIHKCFNIRPIRNIWRSGIHFIALANAQAKPKGGV